MTAPTLTSAENDLMFEALSQKFQNVLSPMINNIWRARQAMIAREPFNDDQLAAAKYAVERLGRTTKSLKKATACRDLAAKLS